MLLVFAFDRAHRGGDQHHAGIGLKPLVIDETDLLVGGLLVLQAKLHPCRLFGAAGPAAGASSRSRRQALPGLLPWAPWISCATAKVVPSAKAHAANNAGPANRRNVFHRSIDEFITDLSSFLRAPIQPALDFGLPRIPLPRVNT